MVQVIIAFVYRKVRCSISKGQISRMKHVELICELMLSIHQNDVINKKAALDRVMESKDLTRRQIEKARRSLMMVLNRLFRMFPQIRSTRFSNVSDFYSLAHLVSQFELEGLVLTDRHRNWLAADLLTAFSTNVDMVSQLHKRAKGVKPEHELYREYLLTVLGATDDVANRRRRAEILRGLLQSLFEKKDPKRLFSLEQRRILWNTTTNRVCRWPEGCTTVLTWEDFTIDHIDPYSKGGRTLLENAALMCRKHNSAAGNRRRHTARGLL